MDLTTATRVKTYLEGADTSKDAVLAQIITGVSARIERYMNRHAEAAERTEYYDLDYGQRRLFLKGYPVTEIDSIYNDPVDQAFGSTTLIAATDYVLNSVDGEIAFHLTRPLRGPMALKVTYTGGMGANAAAFITAFPEIALAAEWQVVHEFHNRNAPGASSVSIGGASVALVSGLDLLPIVKQALDGHRRMAHR